MLADRAIGAAGQVSKARRVWQRAVEAIPPQIGDIRAVFLGNAVAVGHRLEPQVHQFLAVGEVVEDVGDVDVPRMIEIGKCAG